jgi:hypothetical protein
MRTDFIRPFIATLREPGVGISCMQLSRSVYAHVRTTGFCISKETAALIEFNKDPILTKEDCYFFEHRGGIKTLTGQIRSRGLACRQVAPLAASPVWDSGFWKGKKRWQEHNWIFGTSPHVTFICTIYNTYPQIISSLLLQTHTHWRLLLIHDGPNNTGLKNLIPADHRVAYVETKDRLGNWGHGWRHWALEKLRDNRGEYAKTDQVVVTNADNYYAPVFIEKMLEGFEIPGAVATYCDKMVHSYVNWEILQVRMEQGHVDCGGVMIRKEAACKAGWRDTISHSSDWTFINDVLKANNMSNFIKIPGCLFIHN